MFQVGYSRINITPAESVPLAGYGMTFVSTCANGSIPYIPSAYGYIHDCYEATLTYCRPGTAERVADILVRMLKTVRN